MPNPLTKTTRQAEHDAAALRPGAGAHADRRLKRQRTRAAVKRSALRDWA